MTEFKLGDRVEVFGEFPVPGRATDFSGRGMVVRVDAEDLELTYCVCFDGEDPYPLWCFTDKLRRTEPAKPAFAPGDLVELKSGSMKMTVIRLAPAASSEPADHV